MKRRVAWWVIVVCLSWSACAAGQEPGEDRERVVIGTEIGYPPYSFLEANGQPAGYNVDLTRALAEVARFDVEFRVGPWAEIRAALESGRIDAVVGMYASAERDKRVDFSPPYTVVRHAVFVRGDGPDIEEEADLRGRELIVMRGDILHDYALEKGLADSPLLAETPAEALRQLSAGRGDCALVAHLPGLYWIRKLGLSSLERRGPFLCPARYGYAVREGESGLLKRLTGGLAVLEQTGERARIEEKWLGVLHPGGTGTHAVLTRISMGVLPLVLIIVLLGLWTYAMGRRGVRRNRELREKERRLRRLNRVLAAMRRMSKLITQETDRERLLAEACRVLTENRGYHNAWIVLGDGSEPVPHFFQAGPDGRFGAMTDALSQGRLPSCARAALASGTVQVVVDPPSECADCPLAGEYGGRAGLSMRLEHAGRVHGWMSVSVPREYARNPDEQDLFAEVASDLGFALGCLEREGERRTLMGRYEAVLATTSDAVVGMDLDGKITLINPAAERLFGCTAGEASGTPLSRFCPAERLQEQERMIDQVLQTGTARNDDTERLTTDGRRVPVSMTVDLHVDAEGRPLGIYGILRDITDRKHAESKLRESETRFRSLFEASPQPIALTEVDSGRLVDANEKLLETTGYTREEVIGRKTTEVGFYLDEERNRFVSELLRQGKVDRMEMRFRGKGERFFDGLMYARMVEIESRAYILTMFLDVTELKRLEAKLQQSKKLEAIGTLAGGIAHEFNNLLGVIVGNAQLAMNAVADSSRARRNLDEVCGASMRARDMVRQLLAFSREAEQERHPLHVSEVVREALLEVRESLPAGVQLRERVGCENGVVLGNATQLREVVRNLCANGIQATQETGGELEVCLRGLEWGDASVPDELPPARYALLDVRDTGPGIAAELHDRIFDPYFTTRPVGRGIGMGLSVVYGIVKGHSGAIHVASEPGEGTTFRVFLPLVGNRPEGKEARDPRDDPNGERILVVTHDPPGGEAIQEILGEVGYDVRVIPEGKDALERLRAETDPFDLVITDTRSARLTGLEVVAAVQECWSGIPVILCTGFDEELVEGSCPENVATVLRRPVLATELACSVRRVLDEKENALKGESAKVLIVDDDEPIRSMLAQMLEEAGYRVAEAPDGKVALSLQRSDPADVIITDIVMPEKEGLELITELKHDFPGVRIIAISGGGRLGAQAYLPLAEKMGAMRTLEKPFRQEELLRAVAEALEQA